MPSEYHRFSASTRRGLPPPCSKKDSNLSPITGSTQGIKFRIRPANNAAPIINSKEASLDIAFDWGTSCSRSYSKLRLSVTNGSLRPCPGDESLVLPRLWTPEGVSVIADGVESVVGFSLLELLALDGLLGDSGGFGDEILEGANGSTLGSVTGDLPRVATKAKSRGGKQLVGSQI